MQTTILIISKEHQNEYNIDIDHLIIPSATIIDNNSLSYNNETYFFDYLFIDDLKCINNLEIRLEHKKALTNFYLQTSIDNIFALLDANNSNYSLQDEIERVIDFIKGNE